MISLGILVGFVILAELLLRLGGFSPFDHPMGPRYLHVRDATLGVALNPGARTRHRTAEFDVQVAVNSLGFRGAEFADKGDEFRILSLGDSIAFGYGVEAEETYCSVLEAELERVTTRPVRVVNAGVSSYGVREMRRVLERDLEVVRPDLVLCSFFFATDLKDAANAAMTERGGLVFSEQDARFVDASRWATLAVERSDLLLFFYYSYLRIRFGLLDPPAVEAADLQDERRIYSLPAVQFLARDVTPETEARWARLEEEYRAMASLASRAGLPLVIAHVPTRYQATPAVWERGVEVCGLNGTAYDVELPTRQMSALSERLDVRWVDLTPDLREPPGGAPLYFEVNMHPNPAGHAKIAHGLARYLLAEQLVPD